MAPMIGMKMSPTSESTMRPKAAPMITPMARSTTLPFSANFLNSSSIGVLLVDMGRSIGVMAQEKQPGKHRGWAALDCRARAFRLDEPPARRSRPVGGLVASPAERPTRAGGKAKNDVDCRIAPFRRDQDML